MPNINLKKINANESYLLINEGANSPRFPTENKPPKGPISHRKETSNEKTKQQSNEKTKPNEKSNEKLLSFEKMKKSSK